MTNQPRKPLSLKPKTTPVGASEGTPQAVRRGKKKIIKRGDLPAAKLATTKKPPAKVQKKKKPAAPKIPTTSPSDIRMENLNASLNGYAVWRDFKPLAIGVEKQIFQHIARHSLSASKRITQGLLRLHTRDQRYLNVLKSNSERFNLDGSLFSKAYTKQALN